MRLQPDKEGIILYEVKLIILPFPSLFVKLPYLPNQMGQKHNVSYTERGSSATFLALGNMLLAENVCSCLLVLFSMMEYNVV